MSARQLDERQRRERLGRRTAREVQVGDRDGEPGQLLGELLEEALEPRTTGTGCRGQRRDVGILECGLEVLEDALRPGRTGRGRHRGEVPPKLPERERERAGVVEVAEEQFE